jgi:DNA-binding PadR family transcriptional regulator
MTRPHLDTAIVAAIADGCDRRMAILERLEQGQWYWTLPQFYGSINRLLADGVIERIGEKRGTRYRLLQPEGSA